MLLIDKYAYFNKLKHVHPVEKLTFSISLLLFSLIVKKVLISLIIFIVMSAFTLFLAHIPLRYYIKLLLLPTMFLLSSLISILLSVSFSPLDTSTMQLVWSTQINNWEVYMTNNSIKQAITLFFTVLSSISCLYFLILTTPFSTIIDVLRKLKIPLILIELIELTYRFIFIFLETSYKIYIAQNARLGYFNISKGLKSLGLLISALFLSVLNRSYQLSISMNARGIQQDRLFLNETYHYSARNWIIIVSIWLCLIYIHWQLGGLL